MCAGQCASPLSAQLQTVILVNIAHHLLLDKHSRLASACGAVAGAHMVNLAPSVDLHSAQSGQTGCFSRPALLTQYLVEPIPL